jgi:hypothetical protein
MKTRLAKRASAHAFSFIDLLFVMTIVAGLAAILSSIPERLREQTHITIDLNNLRQILHASALYSNENDDHLAHPTWGTIPSGPDGWAYITFNKGRIPDAPSTIPSCEGRDVDSATFTNQLKFFRRGQVSQYLPGVETTWCPKDVVMRGPSSGSSLRRLWFGRAVKVTSYAWNATTAGLVGRDNQNVPPGRTYKVSQFRPADFQIWETNEADPFYFNDAADNPEALDEAFSGRHSGTRMWWRSAGIPRRDSPGGAVVGAFGGSAQRVRWSKVWDLRNRKVPAPNELLNGPGYR